ncbi:4,5-DOPA dioxygenase extradiol [Hydrogenivirga caldilitoris]|uniref:4,5-DOPA dioxygenase extradiol n=1 Tax=Hydrogenivirga caldilitoris TaxID=246264 RepID=A0A497XQI1_9AQUI|nr:class III extradiol ring-cleavage dioxygenase [Hydrogenivirga caldilitoris]RLJ70514.1 4,5-DOPA dioxygenase extradiol [Hydrogenivirga caldilitoris]
MIPAAFISHGSPELTIRGGRWAESLKGLGRRVKKLNPELVLVISAHWLTDGVHLECSEKHKTIHDFYGFAKELYELEYPAIGRPELCREIAQVLKGKCVKDRGLDHGVWTILRHMFPEADIPVTQLSIDTGKSLREHFELGKKLRDFRDRVMVIGSGGAVHNLKDAVLNPTRTPGWAVEFQEFLREKVTSKDVEALLNYRSELGSIAHPTEEHIIPLFYFLGSLREEERVEVLYEGFEFGSVSLLSFSAC